MINNPIEILNVTADNVAEAGIYCIKDKKALGYKSKIAWFKSKINEGLRMKIATDSKGKQLGFIEYIPSELAWRPIKADNFLFIQCIALFTKEAKGQNIGSALITACEAEAKNNEKVGICAMSSEGAWMANQNIFLKNGFELVEKLDRYELLMKKFKKQTEVPSFNDWTQRQKQYKGWHLIYADQCPWHEKSITDLKQAAKDHGIKLNVKRLETPMEAQHAPSGFGTFSLLKDGKLLGDHYLSRTRFENIIRQEGI